MNEADIDLLRLSRTEGVGPVTYRRLLARYSSAAAALDALPRLARAGGRDAPPTIPDRGAAEREIEQTRKLGGTLLFLGQPGYPELLALLDDAPPCLAVLGDIAALSARSVAIVGGRNASANGQRIAENLAAELASSLVVVSGLARGIDAAAHRGALSVEGKTTIAAIAGGLDIAYPAENAALQRSIGERGAVVTEAPPGTMPQARHFPRRNRVIAGLSLGVVVVEAALRSGSLITVRIAQDAGREIFAVPGSPLDPRARGANDLLRQGAVLTETAEDVLANLPAAPGLALQSALEWQGALERGLAEPLVESPLERDAPDGIRDKIVALLAPDPTKVDDLVRRCQFSSSAVMAILLELELAGRVEALPGSRFALLPNAGS
jgi:DNA processing protein